jgi:prepilin signal peptidase PulO-like enzyme (type II secretory pathway)
MILELVIDFFVLIFGLCVGSFLNCFICRLKKRRKMTGRSFCPQCKHNLSWQDLFPVFSFLFLRGKCRYCHEKISIQYPLVEILTGLIFLLVFTFFAPGLRLQDWIQLIFLLYISGSLIIIFIYDLKHYIIPDKVLLPAICIALFYRLFLSFALIPNYLLAAVVASGLFFLVFLFTSGKGMGLGDVKLAILMGLLLGFYNVLVALFLAFFFGAIIGIIMMIWQRKSLKSEIPFGPFLITGTFVAMFYGDQIVRWYLHMFL